MKRAALLLLLALPLVAAKRTKAPAPAVLAVCADIKGKTFGVSTKPGWDNERLATTLSFVRGPKGRVDILADGKPWREPGLTIRLTHHSRDFSYFILTGTFQQARVDSWQVTFDPDGRGRLLWSSLASHTPPSDITRAALYAATCTR